MSKAHQSKEDSQRDNDAVPFSYADGALEPVTIRKAVAGFGKPVLLLVGEYDVGLPPWNAAECAGLFEHAELAVRPGAGRVPWLDDPAWFTRRLAAFLG
jgi:pimeloyl-ACP methyl ester carboxylesterase